MNFNDLWHVAYIFFKDWDGEDAHVTTDENAYLFCLCEFLIKTPIDSIEITTYFKTDHSFLLLNLFLVANQINAQNNSSTRLRFLSLSLSYH